MFRLPFDFDYSDGPVRHLIRPLLDGQAIDAPIDQKLLESIMSVRAGPTFCIQCWGLGPGTVFLECPTREPSVPVMDVPRDNGDGPEEILRWQMRQLHRLGYTGQQLERAIHDLLRPPKHPDAQSGPVLLTRAYLTGSRWSDEWSPQTRVLPQTTAKPDRATIIWLPCSDGTLEWRRTDTFIRLTGDAARKPSGPCQKDGFERAREEARKERSVVASKDLPVDVDGWDEFAQYSYGRDIPKQLLDPSLDGMFDGYDAQHGERFGPEWKRKRLAWRKSAVVDCSPGTTTFGSTRPLCPTSVPLNRGHQLPDGPAFHAIEREFHTKLNNLLLALDLYGFPVRESLGYLLQRPDELFRAWRSAWRKKKRRMPEFEERWRQAPRIGRKLNIEAETNALALAAANHCDERVALALAGTTDSLNGAIDASVALIGLASGRATINRTQIQIDSEQMLILAGGGTADLKVQRGYAGTTAAAHSSGATVKVPGGAEVPLGDRVYLSMDEMVRDLIKMTTGRKPGPQARERIASRGRGTSLRVRPDGRPLISDVARLDKRLRDDLAPVLEAIRRDAFLPDGEVHSVPHWLFDFGKQVLACIGRIDLAARARVAPFDPRYKKIAAAAERNRVDQPTVEVWRDMIDRCTDPEHPEYGNYGGRGVTVYRPWMDHCNTRNWRISFDRFTADVGPRPQTSPTLTRIAENYFSFRPAKVGYELVRRDENDNYDPLNVRWAPPAPPETAELNQKLADEDAEAWARDGEHCPDVKGLLRLAKSVARSITATRLRAEIRYRFDRLVSERPAFRGRAESCTAVPVDQERAITLTASGRVMARAAGAVIKEKGPGLLKVSRPRGIDGSELKVIFTPSWVAITNNQMWIGVYNSLGEGNVVKVFRSREEARDFAKKGWRKGVRKTKAARDVGDDPKQHHRKKGIAFRDEDLEQYACEVYLSQARTRNLPEYALRRLMRERLGVQAVWRTKTGAIDDPGTVGLPAWLSERLTPEEEAAEADIRPLSTTDPLNGSPRPVHEPPTFAPWPYGATTEKQRDRGGEDHGAEDAEDAKDQDGAHPDHEPIIDVELLLTKLTDREKRVLDRTLSGSTQEEIGKEIGRDPTRVTADLNSITEKCDDLSVQRVHACFSIDPDGSVVEVLDPNGSGVEFPAYAPVALIPLFFETADSPPKRIPYPPEDLARIDALRERCGERHRDENLWRKLLRSLDREWTTRILSVAEVAAEDALAPDWMLLARIAPEDLWHKILTVLQPWRDDPRCDARKLSVLASVMRKAAGEAAPASKTDETAIPLGATEEEKKEITHRASNDRLHAALFRQSILAAGPQRRDVRPPIDRHECPSGPAGSTRPCTPAASPSALAQCGRSTLPRNPARFEPERTPAPYVSRSAAREARFGKDVPQIESSHMEFERAPLALYPLQPAPYMFARFAPYMFVRCAPYMGSFCSWTAWDKQWNGRKPKKGVSLYPIAQPKPGEQGFWLSHFPPDGRDVVCFSDALKHHAYRLKHSEFPSDSKLLQDLVDRRPRWVCTGQPDSCLEDRHGPWFPAPLPGRDRKPIFSARRRLWKALVRCITVAEQFNRSYYPWLFHQGQKVSSTWPFSGEPRAKERKRKRKRAIPRPDPRALRPLVRVCEAPKKGYAIEPIGDDWVVFYPGGNRATFLSRPDAIEFSRNLTPSKEAETGRLVWAAKSESLIGGTCQAYGFSTEAAAREWAAAPKYRSGYRADPEAEERDKWIAKLTAYKASYAAYANLAEGDPGAERAYADAYHAFREYARIDLEIHQVKHHKPSKIPRWADGDERHRRGRDPFPLVEPTFAAHKEWWKSSNMLAGAEARRRAHLTPSDNWLFFMPR